MPEVLGQARRTSRADAQRHYEAGGAVLVSDSGETTIAVTGETTTHSLAHGITSWNELDDMVTMWANRYPNQHYYLISWGSAAPAN